MVAVAKAEDKDVVAKAFHTDSQFVVMNMPPRPDAWPGAIFTSNMCLPIVHGDANDPAIHKGNAVSIDSNSGFDLSANTSGGISFLFGASAEAANAAHIVMSFPDARINDMDEAELRQHVIASKEAIGAAKLGQIPVIVVRSYSGTPTIAITKKNDASAEAWAKVKSDIKVAGGAGGSSDNMISYKTSENIVFAFETTQIIFDPKDLPKGIYTIQFASLPSTLYAEREDDGQLKVAKAVAATTGISVDAIVKGGIFGGEASMFRNNLGIRF
jgi:hypothetical protein